MFGTVLGLKVLDWDAFRSFRTELRVSLIKLFEIIANCG